AVARRLPSELKATQAVTPMPLGARYSWPLANSQNRAVLSQEALTRRLPSGLKATFLTTSVCPLRVRSSCPVVTSQSFKLPEAKLPLARLRGLPGTPPPTASRLPSGLKARQKTKSVGPLKLASSLPLSVFHIWTVLSGLSKGKLHSAVARSLPSGL